MLGKAKFDNLKKNNVNISKRIYICRMFSTVTLKSLPVF